MRLKYQPQIAVVLYSWQYFHSHVIKLNKDAFILVLTFLSKWFLRRNFPKTQLTPLEIMRDSQFSQFWIHFAEGCSVSSLVEIGGVFWRRCWKCEFYGQTDRQTVMRKVHTSLQLRWAENINQSKEFRLQMLE